MNTFVHWSLRLIGALSVAAILIAGLLSCKNPPVVSSGPVLHVTGYVDIASTDVAVLWKEDLADADPPILTELYSAANARAVSVSVSGNKVYTAGYYTNSIGNESACYWKNGVLVHIYSDKTGSNSARAWATYVSGTDVYVPGYIIPGARLAGYWKNGTWHVLHDTTVAEAKDIVVSGADVYVAGYFKTGIKDNACYWKNGVKTDLYTANHSGGYGIALSGADVYVAGYYLESATLKPGCWKNDSLGLIPLASGGAKALDVAVSGTDVYVAPSANASLRNVACYWKNGALVDLYNDAVNTAQASGIYMDDTDVYVSGYVNEGVKTACYWKNGVWKPLETSTSECYSLAIRY